MKKQLDRDTKIIVKNGIQYLRVTEVMKYLGKSVGWFYQLRLHQRRGALTQKEFNQFEIIDVAKYTFVSKRSIQWYFDAIKAKEDFTASVHCLLNEIRQHFGLTTANGIFGFRNACQATESLHDVTYTIATRCKEKLFDFVVKNEKELPQNIKETALWFKEEYKKQKEIQ